VADSAASNRSPHEAEALAASDRVVGQSRAVWALRLAGRLAGRALGAVFLAAGLLKALDPQTFAQEIAGYGIVTNPVLTGLLAYAIVIVECGLGAALLANLRPRIMLALAALLLLAFLGVVGYAWATGSTESCGCFGPWTRTPAQAFVEDLLLLAIVPWAWWGRKRTHAPTNTAKLAFAGLGLAAGVMVPAVAGMIAVQPGSAGVVGSEAFKKIEVVDLPVDLSTGEHLVLLMSTGCDHCKAAVPEANALYADERLPRLVAIAADDRVQRGLFREDYGAQYPIGQISDTTLRSLLEREFPRLFLVRDGRVVRVWDGTLPAAEAVLENRSGG
jgi:uncharacterized membrane protein YphA (DoxX/SURF4 family)